MADQRVYNARVTTEALEKKFRDTFPSQAGAELVDDLYASGVIVPTVDFTAAAQGSELRSDLQRAWDYSTGEATIVNANTNVITNSGFWKVAVNVTYLSGASSQVTAILRIHDGTSGKTIWKVDENFNSAGINGLIGDELVVFLRPGDSLKATSTTVNTSVSVTYRQIADVNGNLVNPLGFTFS